MASPSRSPSPPPPPPRDKGKRRASSPSSPPSTSYPPQPQSRRGSTRPYASHASQSRANLLFDYDAATSPASASLPKFRFTEEDERDRGAEHGQGHSAGVGGALGRITDWSDFWGETDEAHLIRRRWKRDLYVLLENPSSSSNAFLIHVVSTALIVFSAALTTVETLPDFRGTESRVWFGLETAIVALFTVEYLARVMAHSDNWGMLIKWIKSFYGLVDLAAILPYYLEIVFQADTTDFFRFSILRVFRLLRVFRAFRYSSRVVLTIEVMVLAFKRSSDALLALLFFVVTAVVLFATVLYFLERGSWDDTLEMFITPEGDPSAFDSIPAAAWFVLVTVSTVGYGEVIPRTAIGRLVTLPLLVFGLLLIALPSFVLGRQFAIVWDAITAHQAANPAPAHSRPHTPSSDGLPQHSQSHPHAPHSYPPPTHSLIPTGPAAGPSASPALPAERMSSPPPLLTHSHSNPQVPGYPGAGGGGVAGAGMTAGDLSNHKLARNQEILHREIVELRKMLEESRREMRDVLKAFGASGGRG